MKIQALIALIILLILPILTLIKKFDLLRSFILRIELKKNLQLPRLNLSFAFFGKFFIYALLLSKSYFSLYMLMYIATNNPRLSMSLATGSLCIIVILLYIFWNMRFNWQNLIVKFSGGLLSAILFSIFSGIFIIFFYNLISFSSSIELSNITTLSLIFTRDLFFCFMATSISFYISKLISNFINNLPSGNIILKIFCYFSIIPNVVFGFFAYFTLISLIPNWDNLQLIAVFSNTINSTTLQSQMWTKQTIFIVIQAIFYTPILISRMINSNNLPTRLTDNKQISFVACYIQLFFEINLTIQALLFFNKNYQNIFYISFDSLSDSEALFKIHFIGFLGLTLYLIYFIFCRKKT